MKCTCPQDRNDIVCPVHIHAGIQRYIESNPIYVQLAWEMDLNWVGNPHGLFWQHRRLPEWPFPRRG